MAEISPRATGRPVIVAAGDRPIVFGYDKLGSHLCKLHFPFLILKLELGDQLFDEGNSFVMAHGTIPLLTLGDHPHDLVPLTYNKKDMLTHIYIDRV